MTETQRTFNHTFDGDTLIIEFFKPESRNHRRRIVLRWLNGPIFRRLTVPQTLDTLGLAARVVKFVDQTTEKYVNCIIEVAPSIREIVAFPENPIHVPEGMTNVDAK